MKLLASFLLTLVLISSGIILAYNQFTAVWPSHFYHILFFLFISTAGLFYYLQRTKEKRPEFFVQFYLLTMAIKLIAYAGFMIFVISRNRDGATANVVFFMIGYLLFTVAEVAFLYRRVNQ
ncbi:MAG: hypothetical protein L6Q51_06475 [Cyclobacteriaceae bacterium]|nr:hypothetical protein [Cyclobacteriaceae bacterium]